ncbi:MAG: LptF/LptG family permease [Kiritimatiellae bacterium]|nr:LptF/LptG family permease [Kiritimatiellia bacterium]
MKTLERYVFGAFLSSFLLAFLVLTFVLTIGLFVQIVGYILDGIPFELVGRFALVSFPETMQWTIPIGLLVASILVFSRMSADSEIAAMRACGVNLLTVMRWPLLFAALCTLAGLFINNEIAPRGHEVRRDLVKRLSVGAGLELLEPGRVIDDFPKVKIYCDDKQDGKLLNLIVLDYSNPRLDRMITATTAEVSRVGRDLVLHMHGMTVDPMDEDHPGIVRADSFQYRVKDALKDGKYHRREKDFTLLPRMTEDGVARSEILHAIAQAKKEVVATKEKSSDEVKTKARRLARRALSDIKTEFMKRWVSAFASICFVLVGIPLGIRAQRRESTIGMAIALVVALAYNMLELLMTSLSKNYSVHPEMLIWLPVVLCVALASRLIPKNL